MPNMTFALSKAMHEAMRRHPNVKWAGVARDAIAKELAHQELLAEWDKMLENSTLTLEDAVTMGREIRHAAAARSRAERQKRRPQA